MPLYSLDGKAPTVHPGAFVAPTATLIGDVTVEDGASIWYNTVLRADYSSIVIRANANVQDGSVLHGPPDVVLELGESATIAHGCVVHGATIGPETIVGNGAVVMDYAKIGRRSLIAAFSMVPIGMEIPDGVMAAGSPAQVRKEIAGTPIEQMLDIQGPAYVELGQKHKVGVALVE